ncbi:aspartyl-phosphate phosphatase Spo0E family protein [Desulfosporosinus sp. FKB]|uniref:aspartyl-phosphate phosphatase Spo0E family protein n=1 Tax=Desulfosporosinus sp. FKB TaxID=1969835 RepID=UPI000B49A00D|nr:aspartyl-phosphate phosphatase Spo0E family protein [Desulfosporosinus sp. FKB]
MSEIDELIKQIEELRLNLINTKEGRAYTDAVVVTASQELDKVLNRYQELLMEKAVPTNV